MGSKISEAKEKGDMEGARLLEEEFQKAVDAAVELADESGAVSNEEDAGKEGMPPLIENKGATAEEVKQPDAQEKTKEEKKDEDMRSMPPPPESPRGSRQREYSRG